MYPSMYAIIELQDPRRINTTVTLPSFSIMIIKLRDLGE